MMNMLLHNAPLKDQNLLREELTCEFYSSTDEPFFAEIDA
jgi:hypothetical protein